MEWILFSNVGELNIGVFWNRGEAIVQLRADGRRVLAAFSEACKESLSVESSIVCRIGFNISSCPKAFGLRDWEAELMIAFCLLIWGCGTWNLKHARRVGEDERKSQMGARG